MENKSQVTKCGKITLVRWSMYRCSLLSFLYVTVCLSVRLTQCSQSLQLVFIVSAVWSADLENLVLAVAARLAEQCPVGTWNPRQT